MQVPLVLQELVGWTEGPAYVEQERKTVSLSCDKASAAVFTK